MNQCLVHSYIQLYVIQAEDEADRCSTSELVSKAALCDDLPEGAQSNPEQQVR